MKSFNWLVNKLRRIRYASQPSGPSRLYFGTIVKMHYSNWKHDPDPLIWVQYSNAKYTHGINLNYLDMNQKRWLARSIYLIKKANQTMNGILFYKYIKMNNYSVARKAYRLYFTGMINRPKMISAGITNLDKLTYTTNDPFIKALNKTLGPTEIQATKVQLAQSSTELQERIMQSSNAQSISSGTVSGGIKKAQWLNP
jgi:hypothetical protein